MKVQKSKTLTVAMELEVEGRQDLCLGNEELDMSPFQP